MAVLVVTKCQHMSTNSQKEKKTGLVQLVPNVRWPQSRRRASAKKRVLLKSSSPRGQASNWQINANKNRAFKGGCVFSIRTPAVLSNFHKVEGVVVLGGGPNSVVPSSVPIERYSAKEKHPIDEEQKAPNYLINAKDLNHCLISDFGPHFRVSHSE